MTSGLAVALTVLGACLLLVLPLVPALVEFHRKSDAQPLSVVQQHAGDIRHFAEGFRSYIRPIEPFLERCLDAGTPAFGTMADGTQYLVLGRNAASDLAPLLRRHRCEVLLATGTDLSLPARMSFTRDIFARGNVAGSPHNQYRAILGERDVHLATTSTVLRWVHANGEFWADEGCKLQGRVSSDRRIRLAAGCSFVRLNAPSVELGNVDRADSNPVALCIAAEAGDPIPPRRLHEGDLELPPGKLFRGDLIVRGNLSIGVGARIQGSVKCEEDVVVGDDVTVSGSLIAARRMRIARNCAIHGPVIAEREILIQSGSQCGAAEFPTTVSAPQISVEEGVLVYGTLWARDLGKVLAR